MERCTEWRGEHAAVCENHVNYIDKLARYEDLGYDPGDLAGLSAPHGDLIDRNTLVVLLHHMKREAIHLPGPVGVVINHAIAEAHRIPAVIASNEIENPGSV